MLCNLMLLQEFLELQSAKLSLVSGVASWHFIIYYWLLRFKPIVLHLAYITLAAVCMQSLTVE
jgi:hypothetical protein